MDPAQGFAAQGVGATVILAASHAGFPLSTTQVISGAIMGTGAAKRVSAVRWGVAGNIVVAWVLTLPASALVGGITYARWRCWARTVSARSSSAGARARGRLVACSAGGSCGRHARRRRPDARLRVDWGAALAGDLGLVAAGVGVAMLFSLVIRRGARGVDARRAAAATSRPWATACSPPSFSWSSRPGSSSACT